MATTKNTVESFPLPNLQGLSKILVWQVDHTVAAGPVQASVQSPIPLAGIVRRITVNEITLQAGGTITITEDDDILSTKASILAFTAGADKDIHLLTAAEDSAGTAISSTYTHQTVASYLTLVSAGLVATNSFQMRLYLEV